MGFIHVITSSRVVKAQPPNKTVSISFENSWSAELWLLPVLPQSRWIRSHSLLWIFEIFSWRTLKNQMSFALTKHSNPLKLGSFSLVCLSSQEKEGFVGQSSVKRLKVFYSFLYFFFPLKNTQMVLRALKIQKSLSTISIHYCNMDNVDTTGSVWPVRANVQPRTQHVLCGAGTGDFCQPCIPGGVAHW